MLRELELELGRDGPGERLVVAIGAHHLVKVVHARAHLPEVLHLAPESVGALGPVRRMQEAARTVELHAAGPETRLDRRDQAAVGGADPPGARPRTDGALRVLDVPVAAGRGQHVAPPAVASRRGVFPGEKLLPAEDLEHRLAAVLTLVHESWGEGTRGSALPRAVGAVRVRESLHRAGDREH